jgi:hypothetical protein
MDNWQWSAAIKRGLALPSTPGPEVVKKIKALGDTNKKLLKLEGVGKVALEKIVDDFLSNYWSSLGLPVDPLVAKGLPNFVTLATTARLEVKVKTEKVARASRGDSHECGREASRGRVSHCSSGRRRRLHCRDWSTSSESLRGSLRERRDRKHYKKGPGGPPA